MVGLVAACGLSLVGGEQGGLLSSCDGFSCCGAQALGRVGFSICSVWAQ